jgi:Putative Ig domain/Fn3 associated/Divergent InlB B-repeat domain
MKKLTFLFVMLFVGQAFSQGTINFNNRVTLNVPIIDAPISYAPGTVKGGDSGARINALGVGLTAKAGLFAGPDGATEDQLVMVGPAVNFRSGPGAGYVNVGSQSVRTLNVEGATVRGGDYAILQVRAWDTGNTNDTWQQALTIRGAYLGKSIVLRIQTGETDPPQIPPNLSGLEPFSISPAQQISVLVNPIPNQTSLVGMLWTYQFPTNAFSTTKPGQILSYSSSSLPAGLSFDAGSRTFSGTLEVAGTYPINLVATDNSTPPISATNRFALILTNRAFTLSVTRTGPDAGRVISTSSNIVCGNTCFASVPDGTVVRLLAQSPPGSGFIGWSGACSGTGDCLIVMNENKSVTARFVSTVLDVQISGIGSVTKTPDQPFYRLGDVVTLTAYPPRWYWVTWQDGLTVNPRNVTIGESNQYTASFYPTTALETVSYNGASRLAPVGMPAFLVNGQFITEPSFTNRGPAEVTILSTFPGGAVRYTLNDADPSQNGILYTGPFNVRKDAVIRAVAFDTNSSASVLSDPLQLVILPTVFVSTPGGGTVTVGPPSKPFNSNEWAVVTATPAEGWLFLEWRGDAEGTEPTTMVRLDRNRCVEAIFGTVLTVTAEGGGSVQQSPASLLLPYGTSVSLTPIPEVGRYFSEWSGSASGAANPLTFVITNANPTVSSLFAPLPGFERTLTVLTDGGGTVSVDPNFTLYRRNMRPTLTAIPMVGQTFLGWSGGTSELDTNNPITLRMYKTRTVTAHFTRYAKLTLEHCQDDCSPGSLRTIVKGPTDTRYQIDVSTNLVQWTTLGTVTNLYGTFQVRDPLQSTNCSQRYYRATVLP